MTQSRKSRLFLLIIVCLIMSCTENPLFTGDDISPGNSKISGQVDLVSDSPENVLVWLEGFDLAVRTDSEGRFEIKLPLPAQQPNNGLTGAFNLYFYVANYRIEARSIVVLNGYVEDHKGNIGEKGELGEAVRMEKLLELFSDLEPDKINRAYAGHIDCTMTLKTTRDSVTVIVHMAEQEVYAGFIVPGAGTTHEIVKYEVTPVTPSLQIIDTEETVWKMTIENINSLVREGDFEVIPYIVILQPFIPAGLMNQLGTDVQEFTPNYLHIPFKRGGGLLHIAPAGINQVFYSGCHLN